MIAIACALGAGLMLAGCEGMEDMDAADFYNTMNSAANMANSDNPGEVYMNALEQSSDPDTAAFAQALRGQSNMGGAQMASSGNASGPRPGAVTPGSYAARPNLAIGPNCPGFTPDNYRTHAFEGGNDKQLYTLCGEAFEYHHMYLNAIQQGYSEADANLTYNAHQKTVQQIQQFVSEAR
jgi:hypothetical protein